MGKIEERGKTYALHKASDKLNDYYGSAMLNVVQFDGHNIQCAYIDGYLQAEQDLKVKDVDLNNGIQLTWEDMRELYIIFAEVDTEIEFCKCDIMYETIGYYQEVLKRFKARKGE